MNSPNLRLHEALVRYFDEADGDAERELREALAAAPEDPAAEAAGDALAAATAPLLPPDPRVVAAMIALHELDHGATDYPPVVVAQLAATLPDLDAARQVFREIEADTRAERLENLPVGPDLALAFLVGAVALDEADAVCRRATQGEDTEAFEALRDLLARRSALWDNVDRSPPEDATDFAVYLRLRYCLVEVGRQAVAMDAARYARAGDGPAVALTLDGRPLSGEAMGEARFPDGLRIGPANPLRVDLSRAIGIEPRLGWRVAARFGAGTHVIAEGLLDELHVCELAPTPVLAGFGAAMREATIDLAPLLAGFKGPVALHLDIDRA
ncbi:hypothetical protein LBMAG42_57090 [Deltaproteobacteria bacterium]|nr:hypothetical protein LBMAG42_57090 [Deltaproteobacteria bacterium]